MATSGKQPPKKGKLKQMPSFNGAIAVEDAPEATPPAQTPFDDPPQAAKPPAQPPNPLPTPAKDANHKPERRTPAFWDRVRSIPGPDWGTRVFMYLYQFEPISNERVSGEKKYLVRYDQPVYDEQPIMVDYGSGKYRLVLTNRKPATGEKGEPIENYDFEIYNAKHPPKLPREIWTNDPRNKRWEVLLPKEEQKHNGNGNLDPLAAFDTFLNIQDRVTERMTPPPTTPPAAPPAPPDPFDTAKKIMEMRSNDPMIAALMQRLDASDKSAEAARQREYDLQKELRQSSHPAAAPPAPAKGLVEQIIELASVADKLEPLKKLFGGGSNGTAVAAAAEHATRPAKMGMLEFLSETLPRLLDSPLAAAAAAKIMSQSQQPQAPGMTATSAPQPQASNGAAPSIDPFQRFISEVATPAMLEYFTEQASGENFAEWIFAGFPHRLEQLQNFKHPMMPGISGAPAIITAYRNTPQVWSRIAAREQEFTAFINEFCAWRPEPEDAPEDVEAHTVNSNDEDGWERPERPA